MSFGPPKKGEQSGILLDVNESPNFWCSQSLHIQREGGKKREEKKRNLSRTKIENGFNFEQPLSATKHLIWKDLEIQIATTFLF